MALKITITGKVHDVGYRPFLLEEADSLFIPNFDARNIKMDGREFLIVLVDGEKEQIQEFLEIVKSKKPEKAVVESITEEEYEGRVRELESYRKSLNTIQLNKIVQTGLRIVAMQDEMLKKQDESLKKQDEMLKKQDESLKKQDKTISTIKEESEKTRKELGGKIDLLRSDLKEYMELNFKKLSDELTEMRKEFEKLKQALRKAGISV